MNKLRLILLALVPALVLMVSACADDEGNTGSPIDRCIGEYVYNMTGYDNNSGVWEIYNENGLNNFRDNVTTDGNVNINAKLVCDIELTNKADNTSWIPIGNSINQYNGTFDGDKYTISGLYINDSTASDEGLFGYTDSDAVIKNLIVKDVEITANNNIGAIVAGNEGGNIINVHVNNATIDAESQIGAIVGTNYGNIYASSASNINITARNDDAFVGGIIGYNRGNIVAIYVDNATLTTNGADARLGGIVGLYNSGEIISSYTNDVALNNTVGSTYVGGIVGLDDGGTFSSNYFVSDNTTLFGVGVEHDVATNTEKEVTEAVDNATRVETIQALNDNLSVMNDAIDEYNKTATIVVGYEFINNGANAPTLQETDIAIREFALSINDQYLQTGDTVDIKAVPLPNNAIVGIVDWENSNPSVATLNNGTITATGNGDTTITARVRGTSFESKVIIRVEDTGLTINGNTYEISNVSGLQAFRDEAVNNTTIDGLLVDNITFIPHEFTQSNWTPIGSFLNQYSGTFDGDNNTISGLYINNNSSDYQGLFGYTDIRATIKDLKVKDVEITSQKYVSAITGYNFGNIINIHVDNVTINANSEVGAIVGTNYGNIYASSASNIRLTATGVDAYIGGVTSFNGLYNSIVATYVDNAIITANGDSVRLGGIVGFYDSGQIVSSYTNNVRLINTSGSEYIGGIVGYDESGTFSSNYFVSDDYQLFGAGAEFNGSVNSAVDVTAPVDNATRVETIQELNNNVSVMNGGIDLWVGNDTNREFGYRYDVLDAPDNATKIPMLEAQP